MAYALPTHVDNSHVKWFSVEMTVTKNSAFFNETFATFWNLKPIYLDKFGQNLGESDFWDSRGVKSTISTHLAALNFDFLQFLRFLKAEIF